MDEKLREEKKAQLLNRIKECLDDDVLNVSDWLKIYDIMVEARHREASSLYESMLIERIGGDSE